MCDAILMIFWFHHLLTLVSKHFLLINVTDFLNVKEQKGTQNGGNPQDGLLEKIKKNKSFLNINFNKLRFYTLFSSISFK